LSSAAPTGEQTAAMRVDRPRVRWRSTLVAARRTVATLAVWSLPLLLLVTITSRAFAPGWAWDFRAFYDAAGAYVHHRSPYPQPLLSAMAGKQGFVYPLPVAVVFVPFWVLPWPVAATLFVLLCAASIVGALWILGVRDWRCYGAALLIWPTQWGVVLGTLSPILAFLLALLWRYRDRRAVAAPLLAVLVVSKLFLWPLALWFLAVRRFRTVAYAVLGSVAAVVLATLPFGLGTLNDYRAILRVLSGYESSFSLSPLSFFKSLGVSGTPALLGVAAIAAPLLVGLVRTSRTRDDLLGLRVSLALAFVLSPIVWGHYLVALLVPLALMRPRFSPVWFALAWVSADMAWLAADRGTSRAAWIAIAWVFAAAQLGFLPKLRFVSFRIPTPVLGVAGAALFITVLSITARYVPFTASLESAAAARPNGAALVQVSHRGRSVCWMVWTQGVTGGVDADILAAASGQRFPLPVRLDHDGRDSGCAALPSRSVAKSIRRHSKRYRLELRPLDGKPLISGVLLRPVDAGRPAGSSVATGR
jgi:hypothetical protein